MKEISEIHHTDFFTVLSISFEKADAEIRGKFAFFDSQIKAFVKSLQEKNIGDAFIISTCNRTEIYTTSREYKLVAKEFCNLIGISLADYFKYAQIYTQKEALNHLFRVAAGLESQIIGDFEIIGQIKNAYSRFKKVKKNSNPYLERAINSAIQVSKKIKNHTHISTGAASVSYAAVHYILKNQKRISEKNILLLGTGEIGQNTLENLLKHVYQPKVKVINRTYNNAKKIAEKFHIEHISFEFLAEEIKKSDILIVATGAPKPFIFQNYFSKEKETLVIDLSVPSNIDKSVSENILVKWVNVDELSKHINKTLEDRKKEIPKAEKIITEMLEEFLNWERKRIMAPKIHHFKAVLKNMERNEMHNIHKKHRYIGIDDMELTDNLIQKITNRFAKFIIDNPNKADEVSQLMHEILVEQPYKEFHEKH